MTLIVALDFNNQTEALALVERLDPQTCALKVGLEMYTRFGATFVRSLVDRHFRVFLDLKFHDIPNTVAQACAATADLGVWMINVHAMGGLDMMLAAKKALESFQASKPKLIAVTVLTSMDETALEETGVAAPLLSQVIQLAQLARSAELDGVVASPLEVPEIKAICGESFLAVTPGIRPLEAPLGDQSRVCTPQQAVSAGSDYLVVGRPITRAKNPHEVVNEILYACAGKRVN